MGKLLASVGGTPELARETFFSESTSQFDMVRYTALLGEEYVSNFAFEMLLLNLPKPQFVTTPLLVLGAENDIVFTQQEVRGTAAAYHTEAELFPEMAHDMMLAPGWAAVAERIHAWLETRCPTTLPR